MDATDELDPELVAIVKRRLADDKPRYFTADEVLWLLGISQDDLG